MKKSEPALAPEWLRSTGSLTGGGSSAHHFSSTSSHSDSSSLAHNSRNRNSKAISDIGSPRSSVLERSSSSNTRRNTSNGVVKHAYSSFNRNHRDKDREREKERLSYADPWDRDSSDPLGSILPSREKDTLQRSYSVLTRKQGDLMPRRVSVDLRNGSNLNHKNGAIILAGQKNVFEKNFPSLGSEDRHGADMVRVASPGLSSAAQSLPVGNSPLIGGEGWKSALAEVPNNIGGNNTGSVTPSQSVSATTGSGTASGPTLNMAEALVQAPLRTRTAPQVIVKAQRLEERAIKQSRQLIPVIPSMPKSMALLSSDKSKAKAAIRIGEASMASPKATPQLPTSLHSASQALPGGQAKSDASKTSSGKLFVLKPSWENGNSPALKDVAAPTNNASNGRGASSQLSVTLSESSAATRSTSSPKVHRETLSNKMSGLTMEKKPPMSQIRSRNDFFKLIKKKTSGSMSGDLSSDTRCTSTVEKPEILKLEETATVSKDSTLVNGGEMTSNGYVHEGIVKVSHVEEKNMSFEVAIDPEEEEAAFLRSLGWEENSSEDAELTPEEINSFFEQFPEWSSLYMKLKSRGMGSKLSEIQATCVGVASLELSSSDSDDA